MRSCWGVKLFPGGSVNECEWVAELWIISTLILYSSLITLDILLLGNKYLRKMLRKKKKRENLFLELNSIWLSIWKNEVDVCNFLLSTQKISDLECIFYHKKLKKRCIFQFFNCEWSFRFKRLVHVSRATLFINKFNLF